MGKPYNEDDSQLVQNRSFFGTDYWTVGAGWDLNGTGIRYGAQAACNQCLFQAIPILIGETYECKILCWQFNAHRTLRFQVGNTWRNFNPPTFLTEYIFPLTPTAIGNISFSVSAFFGFPSMVHIEKVSVRGAMDDDFVYNLLYNTGFAPMRTAQTEFDDLGAGEKMVRIAGRSDSSNCLIKIEP